METKAETAPAAQKGVWTGRIVSAIPVLFLLFDGISKLLKPVPVVQATVKLGYSERAIPTLGILVLACTILYAIPRTSIFGAIFLTGYLGGAVASHFRVGDPLFSHILFPVYMGAFIWLGLYLREHRLRALVPLRT